MQVFTKCWQNHITIVVSTQCDMKDEINGKGRKSKIHCLLMALTDKFGIDIIFYTQIDLTPDGKNDYTVLKRRCQSAQFTYET